MLHTQFDWWRQSRRELLCSGRVSFQVKSWGIKVITAIILLVSELWKVFKHSEDRRLQWEYKIKQ